MIKDYYHNQDNMETLTLLFLLLSIGLYILTVLKRRQEFEFLTLLFGVFSLMMTLTDDTIGSALPYLIILDVFTILSCVVWLLFPPEDD